MAIFKKASVTPIVRTVISQGIEDDDAYLSQEDYGDPKYETSEDKIEAMFKEAYAEKDFDAALSIAKYYFDGFGYEQIRTMVRRNY